MAIFKIAAAVSVKQAPLFLVCKNQALFSRIQTFKST